MKPEKQPHTCYPIMQPTTDGTTITLGLVGYQPCAACAEIEVTP